MPQIHTSGVPSLHPALRISGVCWLVAWALIPSLVEGQERAFEVQSAYHEGTTLSFWTGPGLNWTSVPRALRDIPVPTTDPDILAELVPIIDEYGSAEVSERLPVPAVQAHRAHYFVGSSGIESIKPDSASVTVRFSFNFRQNRVIDRVFWGNLHADPATGSSEGGGFVLRSKQPHVLELRTTTFTPDDLLLGGSTAEQTPDGGYEGRGTDFWSIIAQYQFSLVGVRGAWVFVQWKADNGLFEAGCEYRYSLFKLDEAGGPPTQVAWTSYGCDV